MIRYFNPGRCIAPALAVACALFVAAALVPPLAAQERGAATEEDDDAQTVEVGDEEDDLLEPSNTGYIDDAIVATRLRVRFDAAYDSSKPDRAEFIYGKCTCFALLFGQDAASVGPAVNLDFQELELAYERALNPRFSLFFEVPFRRVDLTIPDIPPFAGLGGPEFDNTGLGDVRVGFKYALVAEPDRYVTFQLRGYLATGDAGENLGTDHESIEPGILFFSRRSERVTIASELRWWHPLDGSSDPLSQAGDPTMPRKEPPTGNDPRVRNDGYTGDILRFGIGVSSEGHGPRGVIAPVAELVAWYVFDGFAFTGADPHEAGGDKIVNLKLGARFSDGGRGSFYAGYGFPLGNEDWYGGIARLEYRVTM